MLPHHGGRSRSSHSFDRDVLATGSSFLYLHIPMEIRISHSFDCPPRTYWDTAWDAAFERELRAEAELDFDVIEERGHAGM